MIASLELVGVSAGGTIERFTVFRVKSPEGFYGDYSKQTNENGLDYLLRITTEIVRRERERFAICQNRRCEKAFVGERKNRSNLL